MGKTICDKIKAHIAEKRRLANLRQLFAESGEKPVPPAIPPLMVKVGDEMVIDPSLELDKKGVIEKHTMEEISFNK